MGRVSWRPPAPAVSPHRALYRGDNLAVLRRFVADESVDLVYLDHNVILYYVKDST